MRIGAEYLREGECNFVVWAPFAKELKLNIISPSSRRISLDKGAGGYWKKTVEKVYPGTRYYYELENGLLRPDPASYFQPEGVHGPSEVVDIAGFQWTDDLWNAPKLEKMIIYELHVGVFTSSGTLESVIDRLDELTRLGITAIELMPVAQFPGERNWGYDGTFLFAVHNSYGGPEGLKRLVDACHARSLAVVLDVVYNHLGPEGNYLADFGPYFTGKYKTPWGEALNFDGLHSEGPRNFFVQNALFWLEHYHIDALRLDAVHGIFDAGHKHILQEISERVEELSLKEKKNFYLIAESDLNDARLVRDRESGGYGIDAQWCDDFHHCLHVLLTGEKDGYYADFTGVEDLAKSLREGFVYDGRYSGFRGKPHGNSSKDIPANRFIVFSQNHDQVGNRMLGERLPALVDFQALKVAAGTVFVCVYIPLLFMGEEYAEDAPFLYFVSHSDPHLIQGVREGRKKEFRSFECKGVPPDPQDEGTFLRSKLKWDKRTGGKHAVLLDFYMTLIRQKKENPVLSYSDKSSLEVSVVKEKKIVFITRRYLDKSIFCVISFNKERVNSSVEFSKGRWRKKIDSSEKKWLGPGVSLPEYAEGNKEYPINPFNFVLYEKE